MGLFDFLRTTISHISKFPADYVVLDIETTGFSRTDDRIIEIAANKYSNGKLVEQYHSYVNPGISIPIPVIQLTGITNADVKNAPTIKQVKREVIAFLGFRPLVGHNIIRFDIPFLQKQMNYQFRNQLIDTLTLSQETFQDCLVTSFLF